MNIFLIASVLSLLGAGTEVVASSAIPSPSSDLEYRNNANLKQKKHVEAERVGARVSSQAYGPTRTHQRSELPKELPERVIHVRSGLGKVKSKGSRWVERLIVRQTTRGLVEQSYEQLRGCYNRFSGAKPGFRDSPIKFTLSFTYDEHGQLDQVHTVSGHQGYYRLTECVLDTLAFAPISNQEIRRKIQIEVPVRFWASRPYEIDLGIHLPTCDNIIFNNSGRRQGQIGAACSPIPTGPGLMPSTTKP